VTAPSGDTTPHARIGLAADPSPAQLAAWRRLWALLLADDPEHTSAPRPANREALTNGTDPLARRTRSDE
jgi:hypothetical protein